MSRLTAELVASLKNQVSGPARVIGRDLDRLHGKQRTSATVMQRTGRMTAASVAGVGRASSMALAGAARVMAPIGGALAAKEVVTQSADFEAALTGIRKKAGTTAAQTAKLGEEIKALATSGDLAVPIEEIIGAYERGAAAGLPIAELKEFARLSAMAADAFEMPAEAVGNAAAGFQTNLDVPIADMERFFDLINGLADAGIADESQIVTFLDKAGAKLKSFGLAKEQSAALGAALLNLKMPADVAARAMDTLTTKLLTPQATKKSTKAFAQLYGDADKFTELLKKDTDEALVDFLKKIEKLDKFKRAELLTDIVGQGFSGEVGALAGGIEELLRNLKYAASTDWFGSLGKSYELKLQGFWSQWQILKNDMAEATIDLGTMGMPAFKGAILEARALIAEVQKGMTGFEATVDVSALSDASTAVGELMGVIGELMGMSGEGSAIERFFKRLATTANMVGGAINTVKDAAQALGLAAGDDDTAKDRGDRRAKLVDDFAEFNPLAGPVVKSVYDTVAGRRTEEQDAKLAADAKRAAARAAAIREGLGETDAAAAIAAERRAYWQRKNAYMGDRAVAPDAGTMILPDLVLPKAAPKDLVRNLPAPSPRPSAAATVGRMGLGETDAAAAIAAERRAYWQRKNAYMGDRAVAPDAGTMTLPDLVLPKAAPKDLVRNLPAPAPRPSAAATVGRMGPAIPAPPDLSGAKAEIRDIDQALGRIHDLMRQLEGGFEIAPQDGAVASYRELADEMQRLMERRNLLDASLVAPAAPAAPAVPMPSPRPDIEGPLVEEGARAKSAALQLGTDIQMALSVTARPNVDVASIVAARGPVQALIADLQRIPGLAREAGAAASAARADYSGLHADISRAG